MKKIYLIFCISILSRIATAQQWQYSMPTYGFDINAIDILKHGHIVLGGGRESFDSLQIMFATVDYGLTWTENEHDGYAACNKSIAFSDTSNGLGVGDWGRIISTGDGGAHWGNEVYPINRNFNKIVNIAPLTYYAVGGKESHDSMQTIIKTTNGGTNWNVIYDTSGTWLKSIYFIDTLKGFAVGDSGVILATTNGGTAWTLVTPPVQRNFNTITFINADTGFIAGGGNGYRTILRTENGGATWGVISDISGGKFNDISFADDTTGYLVGDSALVLKTTDGGQTWAPLQISNTLTGQEEFRAVKFYDKNFGAVAGKGGVLYLYSNLPRAGVLTMGSGSVDSVQATLYAAINTYGYPATYAFYYSVDSNLSIPNTTLFQNFSSTSFVTVTHQISNLISDTTYFFCVAVQTVSGMVYGDTISFFTGTAPYIFKTDVASGITDTTAILQGVINKFPYPITLFFDYDTTPVFNNSVATTPTSVNDTLQHVVSATVDSLLPSRIYYYRLRGVTASNANYFGDAKAFYTGKLYKDVETQSAVVFFDTTVSFRGKIEGFSVPVTVSFEYGTTLAMNQQTNSSFYSDTLQYDVWGFTSGLLHNTLYYYRLKCETGAGTFYGGIFTFYTGSGQHGFLTLPATSVTTTSAQLNGQTDKLLSPTSLIFEYGTSSALGNSAVANPGNVNDSLLHPVSVLINGLVPNTIYYYQLKGTDSVGIIFYGNTKQLYTADCEIPNCDFEVWDTTTTDLPLGWSGMGEVHRVPSFNGSNAVELRGGNASHIGVIVLGAPDGHSFGGAPFAARPDSIMFHARYNIMPGDTGYVAAFFSLNGTTINQQFFPITGNSGGNFVLRKYKISFATADTPDNLSIICMSGNGFSADPPTMSNPISIIAVDDISFIGTNLTVPNNNFEQWGTSSYDNPQLWHSSTTELVSTLTFDPMVKTNDGVSGNYAVRLQNNPLLTRKAAFMASGIRDINSVPTFPVGGRHLTLNAYVKYLPQNGDTLNINVYMYKNGVAMGSASGNIDTAIASYTPFSFDISYLNTDIPDSADISITIGSFAPHGNSIAFIDNLSFDGFRPTTGISNNSLSDMSCNIYPNPASNNLTVNLNGFSGKLVYIVDDIIGKNVFSITDNDCAGRIIKNLNISLLPAGAYMLHVRSEKATATRKFVIQK